MQNASRNNHLRVEPSLVRRNPGYLVRVLRGNTKKASNGRVGSVLYLASVMNSESILKVRVIAASKDSCFERKEVD